MAKIAFINLEYLGEKIVKFGTIVVNPETLQEDESLMDTFIQPFESSHILRYIYKFLDGRVWIFHKIAIEDLMDLFRKSGETIPKARCKIDTSDWLELDDKQMMGRNVENIPKVIRGCYLHLEALKSSLAAKEFQKFLAKNDFDVEDR